MREMHVNHSRIEIGCKRTRQARDGILRHRSQALFNRRDLPSLVGNQLRGLHEFSLEFMTFLPWTGAAR
jgi:hypothetical protein